RWISGKDTGKFVFYSYDFLFRSIKDSSLNLSGDMGFQEILYHQPESPDLKLDRLQAEVHVARGAYLWIELRKHDLRLLACRLSRNGNFPGGFYFFDKTGEIAEHTPFKEDAPSLDDRWRKVDLRLADGAWTLKVDGVEYGRVADPPLRNGHFGFKGSGSSRAAVLVKNVTMTFRNPQNPKETWTERQKFHPRNTARRMFVYAFAFAVVALGLRRWRDRIFAGFLAPEQRDLFTWIEGGGLAVLLIVLVLLPPQSSGIQLPLFVVAAEVVTMITLAALRRRAAPPSYERPALPGVLFGVVLVVTSGVAFALNGESLGRPHDAAAHRVAKYHPDAFLVYPPESQSSGTFDEPGPVTIVPGRPLLTETRAYREQLIVAEFFMPTNCTMDIVFQQQSYLTRGDPNGEGLPFQRRLVRLTTRQDVPMGLAVETGNRPAPFVALKGKVLAGKMNHIEIRSDDTGLRIVLNDEETLAPGFKPLGFGETGFMVFDAPVTLRGVRVETTAGQAVREGVLPWFGIALPFAAALVFWLLLRAGSRVRLLDAFSTEWAALYPLAFYLTASLYLGRESLDYMGRDRLAWLDLALLGSALSHLVPLVFFGGRRAALRFNVGALTVILFAVMLAWDLLPESSEIRLRLTEEAEAPGEIVKGQRGERGPWYSNNRMIGTSTYVWRQQFGGRRPAVPKPAREVRVFVMGGSQAWGSGAASSRETFGDLLEQRLAGKGLPVKVYNAGVNGAGLSKVVEYYRQLVREFEPDIIIADVGLNDSAAIAQTRKDPRKIEHAGRIAETFRELLDLCREDGVDLVLCLEAMCVELPLRPYARLYEDLEALAVEYGAPVVKPIEVTREKEKDHFVWWDTAHFAPYGHHLFAGLLEPAVEEVVRERMGKKR
ncbi:MAG: hypothetical protein JXB04_10065, partial [Kiritimatiellae bacterium]|nr:hypothetical protein [Kiritimatiellia bacterium]